MLLGQQYEHCKNKIFITQTAALCMYFKCELLEPQLANFSLLSEKEQLCICKDNQTESQDTNTTFYKKLLKGQKYRGERASCMEKRCSNSFAA